MNRCQCGHDAADHHEGRTQCLVGWCRCTALTATCPDPDCPPAAPGGRVGRVLPRPLRLGRLVKANRCAAICGLLLTLAGCGTTANPPQAATGASRGQETAHSASPSNPRSAVSPSTGAPAYSRDQFGTGWTDPDHNGCDARQDAIRAATTNRTMAGPCKITRADIRDRYTGRTYPAANPSAFDIDHVVALHDAWNSGAATWPRARRIAFANDPADLVLTTASANRSKGDQDPSEWAPPTHDGACFYARTYRAIKLRWRLHTTPAQRTAIRRTLATCTGTENR